MTEVGTIAEARLSVLDQAHSKLGAVMTEHDGWSVPSSYGSVSDEYSAVRTRGAGLIDLSLRSRINVNGTEAVQFLNGLVTNDVKTLEDGMWMPAAFPNAQGRLLAMVRMMHHADGFLIDTEPATHDAVLKTVERFTYAGDFKVHDLTGEMASISVQGSRAGEIVGQVLGTEATQVAHGRLVETDWCELKVLVIRATHTSEDGFDLFVRANNAVALWDALQSAGAEPVGFDAFEILRIEAGLPLYGVDVDLTNVVLEAGLDNAVSFTKGCYIGQEIIARIHWRGHVAKKFAGLILDDTGIIQHGDTLLSTEGKEIGRITSVCVSPQIDRTIALGLIKYDYLAAGTRARVSSNDGELEGTIVALPFVQGSWNEVVPEPASTNK
jgi:folate-binding protein YgfZ